MPPQDLDNPITAVCPCGSGASYADCCEPIIQGDCATTAETLMRSRYSAYVMGCWSYLHQSWHPDTSPSSLSPSKTQWLGLTIIRAEYDTIEFIARFREQGRMMALHETSRFAQLDGHWRYLDGRHRIYPIHATTDTTHQIAKEP